MFDDGAPPDLYFHNSILLKNICSQVDLIATAEKLPEEDYVDLKLAAVFLLTGYLTNYEDAMEESARHVKESLPGYGFSDENINNVITLIRNSFLNTPETFSDRILHDARYDYLGRVDYLKLTERLYRELGVYGSTFEAADWIGMQKQFLRDHQFLTSTGQLLRSVLLEDQIAGLQSYRV